MSTPNPVPPTAAQVVNSQLVSQLLSMQNDLEVEIGHGGMAAERLGNSFKSDVRHVSYRATPTRCRTAS